MKMHVVFDLDSDPASLRSAWDMRRACRPTVVSPISPSISARGTSAATESTTTASMAPERTSMSQISSACSPVSGCEMSTSSMSTPRRAAYTGSSACSASMKATMPPMACASACICRASVVLPLDSGPDTSTMRPRGTPPMPSAASSGNEPVGMTPMLRFCPPSPNFMMEPLPNFVSI